MTFALRSYAPADFETLYEIDQLCYPPDIAYSRRELRNYLRFPGSDCVIAERAEAFANGALDSKLASGIFGFCVTAHHLGYGYIITMDVLATHRRQGIASALMSESERRMADHGVREVALETAVDNDAAINFWHKHGYLTQGRIKNYYPGSLDALSMTKKLI